MFMDLFGWILRVLCFESRIGCHLMTETSSVQALGANIAVLTAKHGCGFALWPTKATLPDGSPYGYNVGMRGAAVQEDVLKLSDLPSKTLVSINVFNLLLSLETCKFRIWWLLDDACFYRSQSGRALLIQRSMLASAAWLKLNEMSFDLIFTPIFCRLHPLFQHVETKA